MASVKNVRAGVVLAGVLWVLLIGLGGFGVWAIQQENAAPVEPVVAEQTASNAEFVVEDVVVDEATVENCSEDFEASNEMGNPCKDCKRRLPGQQCTRISCDPCCYACVGQPLPICSS